MLQNVLEADDLGVTNLNVSGVRNVLKQGLDALQLLLATRSSSNAHHKNVSVEGWIKQMHMDISKLENEDARLSKMLSTKSTASLAISMESIARQNVPAWKAFRKSMLAHMQSSRFLNSRSNLEKNLRERTKAFGGAFKCEERKVRNAYSKWCTRKEQASICGKAGLKMLWLIAKECVYFDGTVEGFIRIFLESEFGEVLIKSLSDAIWSTTS